MSDWIQPSVHTCPSCGHFLNLRLVKGEGWIGCECGHCGASAPDRDVLAQQPVDSQKQLTTEVRGDGTVLVVGTEGGWWLTFSEGGSAGACYEGGLLVSQDSRPPFPEGFQGFVSWAGDGLIIVDQDPINGTHHACWVPGSLPEASLEKPKPWKNDTACRFLAEQIYLAAYSGTTKDLAP